MVKQRPRLTGPDLRIIFWARGALASIHSPTHSRALRLKGAKRREAERRSIAFTWIRQLHSPSRCARRLSTGMPITALTTFSQLRIGIRPNLMLTFRRCRRWISVFLEFIRSEGLGTRASDQG